MRVDGWDKTLTDMLQKSANAKFKWGEQDCVLWTLAWIKEATGKDFVKDYFKGNEGKYTSRKQAKALFKELHPDKKTMAECFDKEFQPIDPKMAQRGDIVMRSRNKGETETFGICAGRKSCFLGKTGTIMLDTLSMEMAWKIE